MVSDEGGNSRRTERSSPRGSSRRRVRDDRKNDTYRNTRRNRSRSWSRGRELPEHPVSRRRSRSRSRSRSKSRSRSRSRSRQRDRDSRRRRSRSRETYASKKSSSCRRRSVARSKSPSRDAPAAPPSNRPGDVDEPKGVTDSNIPSSPSTTLVKDLQPSVAEERRPRPRVANTFLLGGLIRDQQRTNDRLDKTEIEKAQTHLNKLDGSGRKVRLMSEFLSTEVSRESKFQESSMIYQNGEYVKVDRPYICDFEGCGQRFVLSTELVDHLEAHQKQKNMSSNQGRSGKTGGQQKRQAPRQQAEENRKKASASMVEHFFSSIPAPVYPPLPMQPQQNQYYDQSVYYGGYPQAYVPVSSAYVMPPLPSHMEPVTHIPPIPLPVVPLPPAPPSEQAPPEPPVEPASE
eukprot:GILK01006603.1.p1 GENE.GILK01006603.1~~GILK01006603.1.p1  ORF type:complete len:403 (-),score=36.25 GILK01006603.1:46-1254(-)